MLSNKDFISILIHLSWVDSVFERHEYNHLITIGIKIGFTKDQVLKIIENPTRYPKLDSLPVEDKANCLIDLVQHMKIDGKIHNKEIEFCEHVAMKLGYMPGVIGSLSAYIYKDPNINTDIEKLIGLTHRYLLE